MTKIYYRTSGSAESNKYIDYNLEDSQKLLKQAFEEKRIVVDMKTDQRIFNVYAIAETDVIRVFPIVGGG